MRNTNLKLKATTINIYVSHVTELLRHTHHKSYSCNGAKHIIYVYQLKQQPHATTTNICVSRLTELPRHTHHKSYSCNGAKHNKSNTMRQRLWLLRRWRRRDADDPDDDDAAYCYCYRRLRCCSQSLPLPHLPLHHQKLASKPRHVFFIKFVTRRAPVTIQQTPWTTLGNCTW